MRIILDMLAKLPGDRYCVTFRYDMLWMFLVVATEPKVVWGQGSAGVEKRSRVTIGYAGVTLRRLRRVFRHHPFVQQKAMTGLHYQVR